MASGIRHPKVEIGFAQDEKTRADVFTFRYHVFIEEMGQHFSCVDHEKKLVEDELASKADILFAKHADTVIATIQMNPGNTLYPSLQTDLGLERFAKFPPETYLYVSKLAVDRERRGTNVLGKLFMALYQYGRENGFRFSFCYCAPELVDLYEQVGYRRYKENVVVPNLGYRVPMVILSENIGYLKSVRSPLFRIARKYENPSETADWFAKEFPSYNTNKRTFETEDFWNRFSAYLHENTLPLFNGLSDDEVRHILDASTLLHISAGDKVIRRGDISYGMFVLLSGEVEVSLMNHKKKYLIETCGKGDVFGEMAFLSLMPRTADVVALTDTEALVITQNFLRKMMNAMPKTGGKLLFNLSLILCRRLENLTNLVFNTPSFQKAATEMKKDIAREYAYPTATQFAKAEPPP